MTRPNRSLPLPTGGKPLTLRAVGGQGMAKKEDPPADPPVVTPPPPNDPAALAATLAGLGIPAHLVAALTPRADASGGWQAYAASLADELSKTKTKLREALEAPAGALVITDQAEIDALATIKGKTETFVKALDRLNVADTLEATAKTAEKAKTLAASAKVAGLDGEALAQLPGMTDLETEVRKVGDKEEAFVKVPSADGKTFETVALRGHVEKLWPAFMPSLIAKTDGTETTETPAAGETYAPTYSVPNPAQNGGTPGAPPKGDLLGSILGPINNANKTEVAKA